MPLRSLRKSGQNLLAMIVAPRLHWRWTHQRRQYPMLDVSYNDQLVVARRHRKKYLCRYWGIPRRLRALNEHYACLGQLPASWQECLLCYQSVELCAIELKGGEQLYLSLEPSVFAKEGEIGLFLRDAAGERLYSLSFCLGSRAMLIGGLQGPRSDLEEGLVKWLGKEMHGMRPKSLLITALYTLSEQMGGRQLLGISDAAHTCSHKLKSSYDTFWLEAQASRYDRHWYRLPAREPLRDISEVKSQRRSEFRRREALREEVAVAISKAWEQGAVVT